MQVQSQKIKSLLLLFYFSVVASTAWIQAQEVYWIGGSGAWDDVSHWSKVPGNDPAAGPFMVPDDNSIVIIDEFSGLTNGSVITVPPGVYAVRDLLVTNSSGFKLYLNGNSSTNSSVEMHVFGDITLTSTMILDYNTITNNSSDNQWLFDGGNAHKIKSGGKDLYSVVFLDPYGTYSQLSDLEASQRILMLGGTWNSDGFEVSSPLMSFNDGLSSNATRVPRVFNTGGSDIYTDEWNSGNTYGSLTVNGNHTIYVKKFEGSPANGGPPFQLDKIVLLEYQDYSTGSTSAVDHYNFICVQCEINDLTIDDTGLTGLADEFTINGDLTINTPGLTVQFNGGNGRNSSVTVNGKFFTPSVSGCSGRVTFKSIYTNYSTFIRASGTLTVNDAIIENIHAVGGATFALSSGVLQGSSQGWSLINNPTPLDYYWIGLSGANARWDNPSNWVLSNGSSNGCIPSLTDNVFVDNNAKGGVRIIANYLAQCNDFKWTNDIGFELVLDGTFSAESKLQVGGAFSLNSTAIILANNLHRLIFNSGKINFIETNNVVLPKISFVGTSAVWNLSDKLSCDELRFESGTLDTGDENIEANNWYTLDRDFKQFNFGRSRIRVAGEMKLNDDIQSNTVVNAGTSLIECDRLTFRLSNAELHDLKITSNTTRVLLDRPLKLNRLILSGTGQVNVQHQLTVEDLVFDMNGSSLALNTGSIPDLIVDRAIESNTGSVNPGTLKSLSNGSVATIDKSERNLCVVGNVAFQDINAVLNGVMHAPSGIDDGNNTGIDFSSPSGSGDFYWIAGSGNISEASNYSELSGGCPTNKDPSSSQKLIFDSNGLFTAGDVISAPNAEVFQQLVFKNSASAILSIANSLSVDDVIVDQGYINIIGDEMNISNETKVKNNGFITTRLQDFTTDKLTTESGALIVRAGSSATVKN